MSVKKVLASEEIVFDNVVPNVTIQKGTEFIIEEVLPEGIILNTLDGERYIIDLETFEAGFEISPNSDLDE